MTDKIFLSADQQLRDSFRMARAIYDSGWHPDFLVGLWRGGTPIAIAIHEYFVVKGVRLLHMPVKCSSYTGSKQTHELQIDFPENFMDNIHEGSKVLIVDDTFDSGLTTAKLKEIIAARGADVRIAVLIWKPFVRLQYEFIENHERLAEKVFRTTWGDGTRLVVNYGSEPFDIDGRAVAPMDFALLEP